MRMMMIVKANKDSEAEVMPSAEMLTAMGRYNEDLIKSGILLAAEGLRASLHGQRVKLEGGKHIVKDGPFAESKELIAGFWIIQVRDKAEAVEWAKRIPLEEGQEIELRPVFDAADFTNASPEDIAKEEAWRAKNQKPIGN